MSDQIASLAASISALQTMPPIARALAALDMQSTVPNALRTVYQDALTQAATSQTTEQIAGDLDLTKQDIEAAVARYTAIQRRLAHDSSPAVQSPQQQGAAS